ncbi:MAG: nicotinamide mononucleotide transporter [Bacteroidaceae bacterium]|nr:nicotinamide mononucleotide transporter [Bacteroidaceae bacterium]
MEQAIEIIGTLVGIIYLWLEYRASIYLWVASIIMPAIYLYVYYNAGLYADFGINIYYLLIALYGWAAWRYGFHLFGSKKKEEKELAITHTPKRVWGKLALTYIAAQCAITYILVNYTDSTVPWWDSFTTALSIVGMWMLARKYIEQWWVWLVVDAVSAWLYIYKGLYFTAVLYAVYAIISIFGYFKWRKLMQK